MTLLFSSLKKQNIMKESQAQGLAASLQPWEKKGTALDLQHSCTLTYQVSQSEFLKL